MTISKKALGIATAVILAALVGGYFAFLSPKSTGVSLIVANASMSSTQKQTVRGSVTPAAAGRLIIVEAKSGGTWTEVARTITDATGQYVAEFPMTTTGTQEVRVRVEKDGRQQAATSAASPVTVLTPSQLESTIPKFARTDRPLRITGRVQPIGAREVAVESSPDGQNWTRISSGSSKKSNGEFDLRAELTARGTIKLRVVVSASDTNAAAQGRPKSIVVEDYKAAGKRYLEIVGPANRAFDSLYDSFDESLASYKAASASLSSALSTQVREFRSYAFWPNEVKQNIRLLIKLTVLQADYYNRLSNVSTEFGTYQVSEPDYPPGAFDAAALIRSALGLPKRD